MRPLLILVAALLLVGYVTVVAVLGLLLSPWFFLLLLLLLALRTLPLILGDRTGRVRRYRQDRPPRGSGILNPSPGFPPGFAIDYAPVARVEYLA